MPTQKGLAHHFSRCGFGPKSERGVRDNLSWLADHGYIERQAPTPSERRKHGTPNSYRILKSWFSEKVASVFAPVEKKPPVIENKSIKGKIEKKNNKGVVFDPYKFVTKHLGKGIHPLALADALNGITKRMGWIRHPEAYGDKIVTIQSGNYHAAEHHAADKVRKQEPLPNLLGKLGLNKAMPTKQIKTQNDLHQEIRAMNGLSGRKCGPSLAGG